MYGDFTQESALIWVGKKKHMWTEEWATNAETPAFKDHTWISAFFSNNTDLPLKPQPCLRRGTSDKTLLAIHKMDVPDAQATPRDLNDQLHNPQGIYALFERDAMPEKTMEG